MYRRRAMDIDLIAIAAVPSAAFLYASLDDRAPGESHSHPIFLVHAFQSASPPMFSLSYSSCFTPPRRLQLGEIEVASFPVSLEIC